ncbi:MAG: ABC transporter substrate-binding protein [Gammaproteobacteria bacterium]
MSRQNKWQNRFFGQARWLSHLASVFMLVSATADAAPQNRVAMVSVADGGAAAAVSEEQTLLTADEVIRSTADRLLNDIRENKGRYEKDPAELYAKVREWVFPHFDFPRISRYVLGKSWKQADSDVQERFAEEFSKLMLHTYGSALLAFQDEQIEFLPFRSKADATLVTVKTQLRSADGSTSPIDYRMGNHTGQWKVLDIKLDGISLVKTYRSEYGSIVERRGLNQLIDSLAERNRRNL